MSRDRPRKMVPVSRLAAFADNPKAFRKVCGQPRNIEAAQTGIEAHRNRIQARDNGRRLLAIALVVGVATLVVLMIVR